VSEPFRPGTLPDLVCFSHLRWNFVFQRPQHLMTRAAREQRVFYVEEPCVSAVPEPYLERRRDRNVVVITPHVPEFSDTEATWTAMRHLVDGLILRESIARMVAWYYTPMALPFTDHLRPQVLVYDCMDELSAFRHAPTVLGTMERSLMALADVVFTGGRSLFESKRALHPNVHLFPSSVDVAHFSRARRITDDPPDQARIPSPRLGFFGVIDERLDIDLLAGVADARPDWQIVMLGPVAKIDPEALPRRANLHYLGQKTYEELPHYIAGWNVALLPFARNEATRFISPTKTPEYMAAGKPVVSTSIRDVVNPYGRLGLVRIADTVSEFVASCAAGLDDDPVQRNRQADAFLREMPWDTTWKEMRALIDLGLIAHQRAAAFPLPRPVAARSQ
jgi:UDP-galactopyranose mutase